MERDPACRAAAIAETRRAVLGLEAALPALELGDQLLAREFGEVLRVAERLGRRLAWLEELERAA